MRPLSRECTYNAPEPACLCPRLPAAIDIDIRRRAQTEKSIDVPHGAGNFKRAALKRRIPEFAMNGLTKAVTDPGIVPAERARGNLRAGSAFQVLDLAASIASSAGAGPAACRPLPFPEPGRKP